MNQEHLSMFELDLYFALEASDVRIESHVAACDRCSAYLSQLGALHAGSRPPEPARRTRPPSGHARARPRALGLTLAAGLAVLGAVTAVLVVTPDEDGPAVAVKGTPAVQVLVRRGEQTRPWDGQRRVRTGDSLGLLVACEDFGRVAVAAASPEAPSRWVRLSDGACPEAGQALPFTLVVDDAPGPERFAVVFTKVPIDDTTLGEAIDRGRRDAGAWVARFELDKEVAP